MTARRSVDTDTRHPGQAGITRRQFLVGGGVTLGALAVGGVVAQRTLPLRSYYYRLTGQCGQDGPVPPDRAHPTYGSFHSDVLGADVDYGSWHPVAPVPFGYRYPVVYCLPGRSEGPRWVLDAPIYLADFAAAPVDGNGIRMIALVSLYGSNTYWHARADGEDRMKMLLDEFIPWFEAHDNVGGDRTRRSVMGWSMGGYGAILAAERRPDMFGAVCGASPALWQTYDDVPGDAFDDAADFSRNDVFAGVESLKEVALRVDCGRADVFYGSARAFAARYQEVTGRPAAGEYPKGCHDPGFWRRVAAPEIDFLSHAMNTAKSR
jgi:S-formylglutathione hydrolase FrmB